MNFLADESVEGPVVFRLRSNGHSILYVAEMEPGISDDEVLSQANQIKALLLTGDRDFGELVYRLQRIHAGVLLLRLSGLSTSAKEQLVADSIQQHGKELLHAFSVLTPGHLRIRRRP